MKPWHFCAKPFIIPKVSIHIKLHIAHIGILHVILQNFVVAGRHKQMLPIRSLTDNSSIQSPAALSRCTRSIADTNPVTSRLHHRRCFQLCQATADQKGEAVQYNTSATDAAFIGLCRKAYGNIAGWQSDRDWKDGDETYKGMVEVSRALMKVQFHTTHEHNDITCLMIDINH